MENEELKNWIRLLRSFKFFEAFDNNELFEILKVCEMKKYPAQSYVISEGDRDASFFVILKGKVSVIKSVKTSEKKKKLTAMQVGDCFGEMSIILNEPRSSSVIAVVEVYVLVIKKEDMGNLSVMNQQKLYRQFAVILANMVKRKDQEK